MKKLAMLSGAAAVVLLAGAANRAEAQLVYGGTLRYGAGFGTSVTSVRGPFGGRVTSVQGPFGGGAVSVRGPFGGRVTSVGGPLGGVGVVRPGIVPIVPAPVVVPVPVVQQTVLNPAVGPAFAYSAAYRSLIPPGYSTLEIAATPYYYTPLLPPISQPVVVQGTSMFVSGGVFYQPYFLGGRTVYVVVPH